MSIDPANPLDSLRGALTEVLANKALDVSTAGPFVNYRQVANRLVQEAIAGSNPVAAVQTIIQILEVPDLS